MSEVSVIYAVFGSATECEFRENCDQLQGFCDNL